MASTTSFTTRGTGCAVIAILLATLPAIGAQPHIEFAEVVQFADAVFVGTVTDVSCRLGDRGKLIVTDVTFDQMDVLNAKASVNQDISESVTITYAGGELDGLSLHVSDMPRFKVGEKYVICCQLDGKGYINPLVGGDQGRFRVIEDPVSGQEQVVTAGGARVLSVADGQLQLGARTAVDSGSVISRSTFGGMIAELGRITAS